MFITVSANNVYAEIEITTGGAVSLQAGGGTNPTVSFDGICFWPSI
jgi:hypothetical protein